MKNIVILLVFLIAYTNWSFAQSRNFSLEIIAKDLSEDVSLMSSHNDEVIVLIYQRNDTVQLLAPPVLASLFTLDTLTRGKKFDSLSMDKSKQYLVFLIELDDERSIEQIDPVIRVYNDKIMDLYSAKKYNNLMTYLGDEDLLGYSYIQISDEDKPYLIEIKGRQSLDSYHYLLKFNQNI